MDEQQRDQLLRKATSCFNARRWHEAAEFCRQLLSSSVAPPNAWHLAARTAQKLGDHRGAIQLMSRALELSGGQQDIACELVSLLLTLGMAKEAMDICERHPASGPQAGKLQFLRACANQLLGNSEEAQTQLQAILRTDPTNVAALINLANLEYEQADYLSAVSRYQRAIELAPDTPQTYFNLAGALQKLARLAEALVAVDRALALRSNYPAAFRRRGDILMDAGSYADAIACYKQCLDLGIEDGDLSMAMALALRRVGKLPEAIECLRGALCHQPENPDYLFAYGNALVEQGELALAVQNFSRAYAVQPSHTRALAALVHQKRRCCDWQGLDRLQAELLVRLDSGDQIDVAPFDILSLPTTRPQQLSVGRNACQRVEQRVGVVSRQPTAWPTHARIRVGYLSSDFRRHPVAYVIDPLLQLHDRSRFEIYGFSTGRDDGSQFRRRFEASFEHFIDLASMSHGDAAQVIRNHEIDILVDLGGHTGGNRMEILAQHPAALQVAYLGYPATTGAEFIEYVLVDAQTAPRSHQATYSERLVHLRNCFFPIPAHRSSPPSVSRAEHGLPPNGFVFCSFNNSYKISSERFGQWLSLLSEVPGSVLWLAAENRFSRKNLEETAKALGVAPERLVFAERLPKIDDHLARYQNADLFLDTSPYNAHSTAVDALLGGCPLLTLTGDTFASRVATSLLHSLGLPELVVSTEQEYLRRALELARNAQSLQQLRDRLAHRLQSLEELSVKVLTPQIESAFERMLEIHRSGQPPRPLTL